MWYPYRHAWVPNSCGSSAAVLLGSRITRASTSRMSRRAFIGSQVSGSTPVIATSVRPASRCLATVGWVRSDWAMAWAWSFSGLFTGYLPSASAASRFCWASFVFQSLTGTWTTFAPFSSR
jgi:hypothetical protein